MVEPQILTPESHPDAVDVPVADLESVTLTRGDLDRLEQRIKNNTWAEIRRSGALKADKDALKREAIQATNARVSALEALVTSLATMLIPGLGAQKDK